ncbi:MAG: putative glycosyltransferase, exosortase G system-associated [Anaerolineales bacterium]
MNQRIFDFVFFWGVWLLAPLIVDGFSALASLIGVFMARLRMRNVPLLTHYPHVSIIIPVYNSDNTLAACLRSIARQDYPLDQMDVLVVNNGSRDRSFQVFAHYQNRLPFSLSWHSIINQGKAWALNAGIHLARGTYIFNVDSDVVLAPDAVRKIVAAMEADPSLAAVTGAIRVLPPPKGASRTRIFLAACEFLEYISAFQVGRQYQSVQHNLYTLSGAFSVFRRDSLLQTYLYSKETVTEDTDLTFELYERLSDKHVGCVCAAIAYVHSIETLSALYAQRVRWQRGQIEVSARHKQLLQRPMWSLRGFRPGRVLLIDHTLAFPRFLWTFFTPVLLAFGYSASLLAIAFLLMYLFYLSIDIVWTVVAWTGVDKDGRQRIVRSLWALPFLPLYRMLIFWFRFSGFLHASAEKESGSWRVQDPVVQIRSGWQDLRSRAQAWWMKVNAKRKRPAR